MDGISEVQLGISAARQATQIWSQRSPILVSAVCRRKGLRFDDDQRGLNAVTRSLAIEYAKEGIRFNAVVPGVVDTPLYKNDPKEHLRTLQPMGKIATIKDIVDAVFYLVQADQVTGEILHVDGGAHAGRW